MLTNAQVPASAKPKNQTVSTSDLMKEEQNQFIKDTGQKLPNHETKAFLLPRNYFLRNDKKNVHPMAQDVQEASTAYKSCK